MNNLNWIKNNTYQPTLKVHCILVSLFIWKLAYFNYILVLMSSSSNFMIILSLISSLSEGILTFFSLTSFSNIFNLTNSFSHSLINSWSLCWPFSISLNWIFSWYTLYSSTLIDITSPIYIYFITIQSLVLYHQISFFSIHLMQQLFIFLNHG